MLKSKTRYRKCLRVPNLKSYQYLYLFWFPRWKTVIQTCNGVLIRMRRVLRRLAFQAHIARRLVGQVRRLREFTALLLVKAHGR